MAKRQNLASSINASQTISARNAPQRILGRLLICGTSKTWHGVVDRSTPALVPARSAKSSYAPPPLASPPTSVFPSALPNSSPDAFVVLEDWQKGPSFLQTCAPGLLTLSQPGWHHVALIISVSRLCLNLSTDRPCFEWAAPPTPPQCSMGSPTLLPFVHPLQS